MMMITLALYHGRMSSRSFVIRMSQYGKALLLLSEHEEACLLGDSSNDSVDGPCVTKPTATLKIRQLAAQGSKDPFTEPTCQASLQRLERTADPHFLFCVGMQLCVCVSMHANMHMDGCMCTNYGSRRHVASCCIAAEVTHASGNQCDGGTSWVVSLLRKILYILEAMRCGNKHQHMLLPRVLFRTHKYTCACERAPAWARSPG